MSKAEEFAKELFPDWKMTGVSTVDGLECSMVRIQRVAYIKGYQQAEKDLTDKSKISSGWDGFFYGQGYKQAEKDLKLTWEDIAIINNIVTKMLNDCGDNILYDTEKDFCQEVLKRFELIK